MTFQNAKNLKSQIPPVYSRRGIKMNIYIVPALHDDLINYLKDLHEMNFSLTDEDAKKYSSNEDFAFHSIEPKL